MIYLEGKQLICMLGAAALHACLLYLFLRMISALILMQQVGLQTQALLWI